MKPDDPANPGPDYDEFNYEEEMEAIFSVLAVCLHMGEFEFEDNPDMK